MESILITGLDGSGKSTILTALAQTAKNSIFDILYLPHIDAESLEKDSPLKKTAEFINAMSLEADLLKNPQLKAIAIFSSMLLYKEILNFKSKSGISKIYCERHPLIDTGIYARFYAAKMGEKQIDKDLLAKLNDAYYTEVKFLIKLIPAQLFSRRTKDITNLAAFITQWFFEEQKLGIKDLKKIFKEELPAKIYYLKTKPEILMQRLSGRIVHEVHESLEVLSRLGLAYDSLFEELQTDYPKLIEFIDAGNARSLTEFQKRIIDSNK
jgi:thymidylate kinase